MEKQIKSKTRVKDHAEVFTNPREVNNMLDLVSNEFKNVEKTFLEPACGDGNFLSEILRRKLKLVNRLYKSRYEWEINSIKAISSIYGIELLTDNTIDCRNRLFKIFNNIYSKKYSDVSLDVIKTVQFILSKNIINGNSLTFRSVENNTETDKPIIISEWTFLRDKCKEKVYEYQSVIQTRENIKNFDLNKLSIESFVEDESVFVQITPKQLSETLFIQVKEMWRVGQ